MTHESEKELRQLLMHWRAILAGARSTVDRNQARVRVNEILSKLGQMDKTE